MPAEHGEGLAVVGVVHVVNGGIEKDSMPCYEERMLYFLKTRYLHGARPVYERAAKQGRMLPDGVRFIDSWIVDDDELDVCYEVAEADDRALLDIWLDRWADLVAAEVIPVIRSKEAAARVGYQWDGSAAPPRGPEA